MWISTLSVRIRDDGGAGAGGEDMMVGWMARLV